MSLLTPKEAAVVLKVEPDTVREWARAGRIPARRIGRLWRFDETEIKNAGKYTCPSTAIPIQVTGGFDSRSVVEKFASQLAQRTARRPKNTSTHSDKDTGERPSLVKKVTRGKKPLKGGSVNEPESEA